LKKMKGRVDQLCHEMQAWKVDQQRRNAARAKGLWKTESSRVIGSS